MAHHAVVFAIARLSCLVCQHSTSTAINKTKQNKGNENVFFGSY